ncbi:alpha/beta hydrolase [Photobacterium sp. WH77]|uniref:alpha/beta hydrolase n=1 Tax=unclassified Photobacterium TaxID=2628852 RepID=UPI001C484FEB|nr:MULTISPECIES: alpha/beta hydrolase [unclassified Photobacterium]MBV7263344.1 alpha/beta hydrolase [Photobacterium sp. WH24]MCG2837417.1 alpha/beta hydrolase [Photobacterium sp. WH77]MCG2845013.1 alpha/beta hydrolase [Photobacterium sp. WH80]MDO6582340.1 alpha/beta hydrolase [Photobacterium sp. 2_MG-2023]
MSSKLNILLVHGAWGDASHWRHVIPALHNKGYNVRAVQNPLTSLPDDIERTSHLAASLEGPVLMVGHSYGGMVITGAGNATNVVGLVYIAAFAPNEGENPGGLFGLREPPPGAAIIRPDEQGFLWLDPNHFHENFCPDVDETEALVMALSQKPIAARCFEDKSGSPAWKVKPSWYQVSAQDRMIPPETEKWFAERIQAKKTITLQAGHAPMASHPNDIIELIDEAARQVS